MICPLLLINFLFAWSPPMFVAWNTSFPQNPSFYTPSHSITSPNSQLVLSPPEKRSQRPEVPSGDVNISPPDVSQFAYAYAGSGLGAGRGSHAHAHAAGGSRRRWWRQSRGVFFGYVRKKTQNMWLTWTWMMWFWYFGKLLNYDDFFCIFAYFTPRTWWWRHSILRYFSETMETNHRLEPSTDVDCRRLSIRWWICGHSAQLTHFLTLFQWARPVNAAWHHSTQRASALLRWSVVGNLETPGLILHVGGQKCVGDIRRPPVVQHGDHWEIPLKFDMWRL
jgi:hypothetical protein